MTRDSLRKLQFSKLTPKKFVESAHTKRRRSMIAIALASIFPLQWVMLCVHGLRVLHNKHFESTLLSSNIRPILFEFCELQYLHSIPYGTTLRQNLGLNSALPFKDSDTTWDSNYSHPGWETVSCSRWHQYPRKKTRGASDCLPPRVWVIWVSGRVAIFQR